MNKYQKIVLVFVLLFTSFIFARDFTVASYNVENLFDMVNNGTEYREYKPNTKYWNKKTLAIKLKNTSRVIKELNADIIALQEVETKRALRLLLQKLPMYKYSIFLKNKKSSVGVGFLSKYKIIKSNKIIVSKINDRSRPILEIVVEIGDNKVKIFNNHWRSKRAGENKRVKYATALKKYISKMNDEDDYILLGDFNSNYNEWQTFKNDKKLNNTYGITGINQIINTTIKNKFVTSSNILKYKKNVHYNLWLELSKAKRFSALYRKQKNTPDNMILPKAMFDGKNISYKNGSFKVFTTKYLLKNGRLNRWNKNKGYSDHLPIIATFTTKKPTKITKSYQLKSNTISHLYNMENLTTPVYLKNVIVIYKYQKGFILKQKNNRSIYVYKNSNNISLGNIYNLNIEKMQLYNGLLEVEELGAITKLKKYKNYKDLYLDGAKIDIFDKKYINEIVTNLKGKYKKRYLYLKNGKKIRLFIAKDIKKPKNGKKITITSGHITIYKGQIQISIHKQNDIL